MGIAFAECGVDQLPSLREFFARVYRPGYVLAADEALLRWQFGRSTVRNSHENAGYRLKLAWLDGAIVGCLGYIPVEVTLAGRVWTGAWTANWIVDPEHRSLGLGPLLMRDLMGQFDVTLVVGLSREARGMLPRLGWTDFGELDRYICILDSRRAAVLTSGGSFDPLVEHSATTSVVSGAVERLSRFSEDVTTLWDEMTLRGGTAGTRRSAEYLNWRYAEHPAAGYRIFAARSSGKLKGVAVYRVEQVRGLPVHVGRLVELFGQEAVEERLLEAVLADARQERLAMVDFFPSERQLEPAMRRAGFLAGDAPAVAGIPRLFQPIDRRRTGISFMAHLANIAASDEQTWYATTGDGDQDRPN